jgi:hypothetical protein
MPKTSGFEMDWIVNAWFASPMPNTSPSTVATAMPNVSGSDSPSSGMYVATRPPESGANSVWARSRISSKGDDATLRPVITYKR